MFCTKCGGEYDASSAFCPNCGTPVNKSEQPQVQEPVSYAQPAQQTYAQPQMQEPVSYTRPAQQAYPQQRNYNTYQANNTNFNQPYNQGFSPMLFVNDFINEAKSAHTLSIVSIIAAFIIPIAGLICGLIATSKAKKLPMINEAELDDMMRFQYLDARSKAETAKKLGTAGWIVSIVVWVVSFIFGFFIGFFSAI